MLTDIEIQKDANRLRAKRKIEIVLQQWETVSYTHLTLPTKRIE